MPTEAANLTDLFHFIVARKFSKTSNARPPGPSGKRSDASAASRPANGAPIERTRAFEPGAPTVEIARHRALAAPTLGPTPAQPRQVIGDRAQDIAAVVPDVAPSVAAEIDGIAEKGQGRGLAL